MLSPGYLPLLGLIPVLIGIYLWILRRRKHYPVRFSSFSLLREALPGNRLRRHLPFILFLASLSFLTISLSRPVATLQTHSGRATIILAIDVSRSMCSVDIPPNRLEAAKEAARDFVKAQPPNTQIGIASFAGFAALVQAPTEDRQALLEAIDHLSAASHTAIGSAILESIDAIAETNPAVLPSNPEPAPIAQAASPAEVPAESDIIVLLTDGASNRGPLPLAAADQAARRGIPVYPIGFGAQDGVDLNCPGFSFSPGVYEKYPAYSSNGSPLVGGQAGNNQARLDEIVLTEIARRTNGEYFTAQNTGELREVFQNLTSRLERRPERVEVSFAFVAVGTLLIGSLVSRAWFSYWV